MNYLAALRPMLRVQTCSSASASSTALRNSARRSLPSLYSPRSYSSTPPPKPEPAASADPAPAPEQSDAVRSKAAVGPFTLRAAALFALTGAGLYMYFQSEKEKVAERKRAETATAKIGKPKIGGPFVLTDQDGGSFSEKDLLGKWSLVYFGFTNCPDICPEELDKMGLVVTAIADSKKVDLLPVFITCDPARDSIAAVKAYVKDFHPSLVGLTGTYEDVKKCCKAYRVYFSTPPSALPTDDYLVDHSIFFYLMDPHGKFVDAFGRSMGPEEVQGKIGGYLKEWEEGGGRGGWTE